MRIISDGTTLRAYYRFAGEAWTPYGEPALLASVPNPKIGVYANDSNATVTTRNDAVFDFFRITAGAAGHDGAGDDGGGRAAADGRTAGTPATSTVTLSTEAGATTEYKLGNGAYQNYTGPVTRVGRGHDGRDLPVARRRGQRRGREDGDGADRQDRADVDRVAERRHVHRSGAGRR